MALEVIKGAIFSYILKKGDKIILEIIRAVILGIVEGITEWLPISSTGHMILVNSFMKNKESFTSNELFIYVIQFGAILAVVSYFFKKLNPFSPSKSNEEKKYTWQMWFRVIVGCLPAAIIGLLLDPIMEKFESPFLIALMLIIYGVLFIIIESIHKTPKTDDMKKMTYKTAFLIGLFQVLSIIPGTSRSGATILGAIILGCSRKVAAEFSFFMAIPVMVGVSSLKILKNLSLMNQENILILLVGMAVAYIVSMISIKMLMSFVRKHNFKCFGWYRIILGLIVIIYFII